MYAIRFGIQVKPIKLVGELNLPNSLDGFQSYNRLI